MTIQAVIFDRDNTLVRFDRTAMAALEAQVATVAPTLPHGIAAAHWQAWPGPWPRCEADEPRFWQQFWDELAARYHLSPDSVARLREIGAFYHSCFVAFPDTIPCIRRLRARGLGLAILTNFELPSIATTLRSARLEPAWFNVLLSSATLGVCKPDPQSYLAIADALGLQPKNCAFVDDLPENIEGARAVGMYGILLDRQNMHSSTQLTRVASLGHLAELLESGWVLFPE